MGETMFSANNYWRRLVAARRACSELLFCLGLVLVPALVAADMSVWLGCRDMSRAECVDFLVLAVAQTDFPAGASP